MITPSELEETFVEFSQNLQKHAPDGVIEINLQVLQELGLLQYEKIRKAASHEDLMNYFHVFETFDKVALFNEEFIIWIYPRVTNGISVTVTFIALVQKKKPHLELVFSTSGVYNTPQFILKVLDHFLSEVVDTEKIISSMNPRILKKKLPKDPPLERGF